jgi:hypothetical protein
MGEGPCGSIVWIGRNRVKQSAMKAMLTDVHLWVPVVVLVFGAAVLLVVR